ncbi:AraC family transcriptional regulator [Pseudomonas sp.]|uniref:AraC family transcriptional regulator n=1 Tax=Pseudomonas sp. TaxID=306 RepID=UPI003C46FD26
MQTKDWVRHTPQTSPIERLEAFFGTHAFNTHQHDTYAIGITLHGAHRFNYRGEAKVCAPGEVMVVHPDEQHDGRAGTDAGFRYQGLYLPPALVQQILQGKPLPFLKTAVSQDPRLTTTVFELLHAQDLDPMSEEDALLSFVTILAAVTGQPRTRTAHHFEAARRARDYIHDNLDRPITLDELAECAGRDRWSLSKDFRVFYGTSPHRYITARRLSRVKLLVQAGQTLSKAAVDAGFFDQSHMSRHFTRSFGIAPSRWLFPEHGAPAETAPYD